MNIRYWLLINELEQRGKYLDVVHLSLQDYRERFEESVKQMANELPEKDRGEFYEAYLDEYIELNEDFPRQLYSSFVVSWYSLVEHELIRLCESLKLKITLTIRDRTDLGKGIRRARRFLEEVANYEIDNKHWQELVIIGNIRNKIVHEGQILNYSRKGAEDNTVEVKINGEVFFVYAESNLCSYLEKHKLLKIHGLILINPSFEYCKYLVKLGQEFFEKIYRDLALK